MLADLQKARALAAQAELLMSGADAIIARVVARKLWGAPGYISSDEAARVRGDPEATVDLLNNALAAQDESDL